MSEHPPEGPKANFTSEDATEGYIPNSPKPDELNKIAEAQAQITDEWTGETPAQEKPLPKP
jgi:hypothetical protein